MDFEKDMLEAFLNQGELSLPNKLVYAQITSGSMVEICYRDDFDEYLRTVELLEILGFIWSATK